MIEVTIKLTPMEIEWLNDQINILNMTEEFRPLVNMCHKVGVLVLTEIARKS